MISIHNLTFFILLFTLISSFHAQPLRINSGGDYIPQIGFRADLTAYLTNPSTKTFGNKENQVKTSGSWSPVYKNYRYASKGDLVYQIPVPSATYSIAFLFAETWPGTSKLGARVFDVKVNGKVIISKLDIFKSVGKDKPLFIKKNGLKPENGFLTISFARIFGKENPMVSGIVIDGPGATQSVGSLGIGTNSGGNNPTLPPITTTPTSSSSSDPTCSTGIFAKNTATNQFACCPKACGKCGGVGCGQFSPGNICCISSVVAITKSCDISKPPCVPSSDLSSTTSPPTTSPPSSTDSEFTCKSGILGHNKGTGQVACCESACGKCGGNNCGKFAPGKLCCISSIFNSKKSCDTNDPPCIPQASSTTTPTTPPPTEKPTEDSFKCPGNSILGYNPSANIAACCNSKCGKCGGVGCGGFAKGEVCCISSVNSIGKSCSTNGPPCVPQPNSDTDTGATNPPTTTNPNNNLNCDVSGASTNQFRMNTGAGEIPPASVGADNEDYISSTSKGLVFQSSATISSPSGPQPWDFAYTSHRWSTASVLSYKIPLPAGSYTVKLLFAEIFFSKSGKRKFDIFLNGVAKDKNLDVFDEVGKNKGLMKSYSGIQSKGGFIIITLIKSVENPMISGIFIEGTGAGNVAVGGGCQDPDDKGSAEDLNGGFNHRAHSVPGGPYIATDFDKNGVAFVSFDGTQSHSHYSDPGPPEITGTIVSYKWTWTEKVNGKNVKKTNNDKSGKFTAPFPLGKTIVSLEVVDQTGDVATDTAEVIVKQSTENGAYCYYYDFKKSNFGTTPLPASLTSKPKPLFGSQKGSINFDSLSDFGDFDFIDNSFAVRCVFFIDIPKNGQYSFTVKHNGPFKLYHSGVVISQSNSKGTTKSSSKGMLAGLNAFQILYFRPSNLSPLLVLSPNGVLSGAKLQFDSAATLPVITGLSKGTSAPSGGSNIQIYGSGFINGVSVKFGDVEASNLVSSDPGVVQVTVPEGFGEVSITVTTNAGESNEFPFVYTSGESLDQPVIFKPEKLVDQSGSTYKISFVAAAVYGPDGRLYLGTSKGKLYALEVDNQYKVTAACVRSIGTNRAILGLAFNPTSNNLKMYYTTSGMYWKDQNLFNFEDGWSNGKVETITWSDKNKEDKGSAKCAGSTQDLITGLPVSNHDHAINKLLFLPNGKFLIGIGGFTNGGISVPGKKPVPGDAKDDNLGGVASNPLSAAIVECPWWKKTDVKYDQYADPEKSKIVSGKECKVYASGFRNTFGMALHTNGAVYATDNGPNFGFGDFSTNCNGGKTQGKNIQDKFFRVNPGKYHGHPNLNRGECLHYPSSAVKPLIPVIKSSSNGVVEYRSNTFGGEIKGNMYISKFAGQNNGQVGEVKLGGSPDKLKGYAGNFLGFSGLSIVEGPRGELVMPRVYQGEVIIAVPQYPKPGVTFMIGVHPKQGPAFGGQKVLISGFNFGDSPTATFDGKECTNVQIINDEAFTCLTPGNSKNKQVPVVVTGTIGKSPSYGSDYWYF